MVRGGRKAQVEMSLDGIISVVFFGLFGVAVILYVITSVDATAYQAKFHAFNLQTAASAVAAGNGDVLLRYDNFREDAKVGFRFRAGEITAGKIISGGEEASAVTDLDGGVSVVNPIIRKYGMPLIYPVEVAIAAPRSIIIRKLGEQYAITETIQRMEKCPSAVRPKFDLEETKIFLKTDESFSSSERAQFIQTFRDLGGLPIEEAQTEEDATMIIELVQEKGDESVSGNPTSDDGREILCSFHDQISTLDPFNEYVLNMPSATGQDKIELTITLTTGSDSKIDENLIGTALKLALVRYFR